MKGEAFAARLVVSQFWDVEDATVVVEGDAQSLIQQLQDPQSVPDWTIEEDVLFIQHRLSILSQGSICWEPHAANCLAHDLARWCSQQFGGVYPS